MELSCRFYEERYPAIDDVIVVRLQKLIEMGISVELLEYNCIEGLILVANSRRVRSRTRAYQTGAKLCARVIRVDQSKGYIDLSLRGITPQTRTDCEERYAKSKCVMNILNSVAISTGVTNNDHFEDLLRRTAWKLDELHCRRTSAYQVFKEAILRPSVLDECDIDTATRQKLLAETTRKLDTSVVKVRAAVSVTCYGPDGVDAVRVALGQGSSMSTPSLPVKITYLHSPLYEVVVTSRNDCGAFDAVNLVLEKIKHTILQYDGGSFEVKNPADIASRYFGEEEIVYSATAIPDDENCQH